MTSTPGQTDLEAAALRRLVDRQDFAAIPDALARYVQLLQAETSPAKLGEACALIEWARRNLRAALARMSEERDRLLSIAHYQSRATPPPSRFHIDA